MSAYVDICAVVDVLRHYDFPRREELIQEIEWLPATTIRVSPGFMLQQRIKIEQEPTCWISVREKLPEITPENIYSGPVLVADADGDVSVCCLYRDDDGFAWTYSGVGPITHWMPIPAPPVEDRHD